MSNPPDKARRSCIAQHIFRRRMTRRERCTASRLCKAGSAQRTGRLCIWLRDHHTESPHCIRRRRRRRLREAQRRMSLSHRPSSMRRWISVSMRRRIHRNLGCLRPRGRWPRSCTALGPDRRCKRIRSGSQPRLRSPQHGRRCPGRTPTPLDSRPVLRTFRCRHSRR